MRDGLLLYTMAPGKEEGIAVLKLQGPFTLSGISTFQDEFRAMKPPVMILDLRETTYMDSAGLGLIMKYHVSAERDGRRLLLAGANDRIHALLGLTRVSALLRLYPTLEDAEADV